MAFHINSMKVRYRVSLTHNTRFGTPIISYDKSLCVPPTTCAINTPDKLKFLLAACAGDVHHSLTSITAAQEQPSYHLITDFHTEMRHAATCYQVRLT